ncbi:MAG: ester cyclase, partial [Vicinamibacterales bacterium]
QEDTVSIVETSLRNARRKVIREHIRQESTQDLKGLLAGMTKDCVCAVNISPRPFVGPKAVADRYLQQWRGFPDFKVRVRRIVAEGTDYVVTENEWRGTHRGPFFGFAPTGKRAKVRACVLWEFRGSRLRAEYVYFDLATVLSQVGVLDLKKLAAASARRGRRKR